MIPYSISLQYRRVISHVTFHILPRASTRDARWIIRRRKHLTFYCLLSPMSARRKYRVMRVCDALLAVREKMRGASANVLLVFQARWRSVSIAPRANGSSSSRRIDRSSLFHCQGYFSVFPFLFRQTGVCTFASNFGRFYKDVSLTSCS